MSPARTGPIDTATGTNPPSAAPRTPGDDNVVEKAVAPLASVSSHVDPYPHYIVGAACAGASGFSYTRLNNPRYAAVAGAVAAGYFLSGRMLSTGNTQAGYDLATATSVALLAATGPLAYSHGEAYSAALASLGGISFLGNLVKSYQMRTGKPMEMDEPGSVNLK